jgi:hypothetical protein
MGRAPGTDAYWQRRFFALVAGLGVLGLLAWACSGMVGGKPARNDQVSAAAYGSAAPARSAGGQPGAGAGAVPPATSARGGLSASAAAAAPSPSSSAGGAPSPTSSASRPTASTARGGTSKVRPGQPAAGNGACPAADIVLTLLVSKPSYGPDEQPRFQLDVVSTDASACAFDTGPAALHVVISHGGQIAWNSAACLHGAASYPTLLQRGVPVTVSMGWNRRLTASGCPATTMAASRRTYVAVAQSGAAESPGQLFRLK